MASRRGHEECMRDRYGPLVVPPALARHAANLSGPNECSVSLLPCVYEVICDLWNAAALRRSSTPRQWGHCRSRVALMQSELI